MRYAVGSEVWSEVWVVEPPSLRYFMFTCCYNFVQYVFFLPNPCASSSAAICGRTMLV